MKDEVATVQANVLQVHYEADVIVFSILLFNTNTGIV